MRKTTLLLAALTTARLTRFVTTDTLGAWLIKTPIDGAMDRYAAAHLDQPEPPWWWRYRYALDCPWCVGFWLAVLVVAALTRADDPGTRDRLPARLVRSLALALALNYVTTHAASRLGDYDDDTPAAAPTPTTGD